MKWKRTVGMISLEALSVAATKSTSGSTQFHRGSGVHSVKSMITFKKKTEEIEFVEVRRGDGGVPYFRTEATILQRFRTDSTQNFLNFLVLVLSSVSTTLDRGFIMTDALAAKREQVLSRVSNFSGIPAVSTK